MGHSSSFQVAGAGVALLRPFNRHRFDFCPASPPMTQSQKLPLPPADRHDLAKSAMHLCTAVEVLQPQHRLNLVG